MVKTSRTKSGFTLVELIIVIAVIGVLAAILIPVFSNVIDKANAKSALSDAKNTLTLYLSEKTETGLYVSDTLFFVKKAGKLYLFGYDRDSGELTESSGNPYEEESADELLTQLVADGTAVEFADMQEKADFDGKLSEVTVWSGYSLITLSEGATNERVNVYVSISDEGTLALARKKVQVYDADGDGSLTVNDTLMIAHKNYYSGGSTGYATETTGWGLGILKLWGVQNGGSYGYYVNNASAWALTDTVSENDYLYAFSYADAATYTDTFSYFDINYAAAATGEGVTLTLFYAGYDAAWNPVTSPLANAELIINGERTSYTTQADGTVTVSFDEAGVYTVSAVSPSVENLVPPVCIIEITD